MTMLDLSKICNWKLVLPNNQKTIDLYTVETVLPGITIGKIELPFSSMVNKLPGDSITFNEMTLNVLVDKELIVYRELMSIINATHNADTNVYEANQQVFDMYLIVTSNKNNPLFKLHFVSCWIETFSDIALQSSSGDDNPYTMNLGIPYNYYLIEDL